MNDHEDLIQWLEENAARTFDISNEFAMKGAAAAIKQLVARAKKAEADLAAARAALRAWEDQMNLYSSYEGEDDPHEMILIHMEREHAPAIAAARAEEKADG